jgi:hypothetical protein
MVEPHLASDLTIDKLSSSQHWIYRAVGLICKHRDDNEESSSNHDVGRCGKYHPHEKGTPDHVSDRGVRHLGYRWVKKGGWKKGIQQDSVVGKVTWWLDEKKSNIHLGLDLVCLHGRCHMYIK